MKKTVFFTVLLLGSIASFSQKKTGSVLAKNSVVIATIPAEVQGSWMYGNFSMTEYWSTAPRTYLGNAFTFAIAFTFKADGTYEHYFTSSTVSGAWTVYHQSVTKGKFTVDAATKTITTYPATAHYKRTKMGMTDEERDLRPDEITSATSYQYTTGTEPSGTKALHLTMKGTKNALAFLKK